MEEFTLVDKSLAMFEKASGCKLHRDPQNMKCKFLPLGRWRTSLKQADIPCDYMTLSDHLDMVGVTLMATWQQTRKINGDALQLKIKNTVGPWKAGKFMPITQRGWSLNSYALSKVWFRTKCIDLRVCDIKKITSTCKSWLYQDMFAKPEEMVIHRPQHYGGLGLHSVKYKALAGFITTFMQTAANTSFQPNLLHTLLYRKHVLGEDVDGVPDPPPPYISQELLTIIRTVKEASSLNIVKMSEKDWTRLLTEDHVTMSGSDTGTDERHFIPCRAETASPSTDWALSWMACRQPGIPPDLASFLWKMLHDLLPTQSKLHRMGSNNSPTCKIQGCLEDGTLQHELIHCNGNDSVGIKLLQCLQHHLPDLSPADVLRLQHGDIGGDISLPVTLITAITLNYVWKERQAGLAIRSYRVRAEIEQYIALLRTSRLNNTAVKLAEMANWMFK